MNTKKTLRIALAALIGVSCLLCGLSTAFAAAAVTVTINPNTNYAVITFPNEEKDLFDSFKNLMPGDSREQEIRIVNNTGGPMEVFLRAEAPDEEHRAFLNQLEMVVILKSNGFTQDAEIASYGRPDEPKLGEQGEKGKLTSDVSLGTVPANAAATLLVKLYVPTTLGNEFAGRTYKLPWTFKVEDRTVPEPPLPPAVVTPTPTPVPTEEFETDEIPTDEAPTDIFEEEVPLAPPQTGDAAPSHALFAALSLAGLLMAAAVWKRAKKA